MASRLFAPLLAAACASACLLAPALHALAQGGTVIYRCTDAAGAVTLRNGTPCPKGNKQERRDVEAVPSLNVPRTQPGATPATAAPTRAPGTPAAAPAAASAFEPVLPLPQASRPQAERLPPPPLYRCNTADNDSYLSDTAEPKPRCLRVDTVGIDGSQSMAAGQACRMVFDQCERIPDNAACPAWRKRTNEAQAAWTFARADMRDAARADYDRIARVVAETTCNTP